MQGRWNIEDLDRPDWAASAWLEMEAGAIGRVEGALRVLMSSAPSIG